MAQATLRNASLDLTEMGKDSWIEFMKEFRLTPFEGEKIVTGEAYDGAERRKWLWESKDLENGDLKVSTCNNPITGKYGTKGGRKDEKGYCSYMALQGDPDVVESALDFIEENANFIKEIDRDGFSFTRVPNGG